MYLDQVLNHSFMLKKKSGKAPLKGPPAMLIFGAYEGQRMTLEVPLGTTVQQLKEDIQQRLGISVDLYKWVDLDNYEREQTSHKKYMYVYWKPFS